MKFSTLLILAIVASSCLMLVDAHRHHLAGNVTCGTPDVTPLMMNRIRDIAVKKKARVQRDNIFTFRAAPAITFIDTYFCVITDNQGKGDVDDSVLKEQIAIINKSFATSGSNLQFQMKGASRYKLANAYDFIIDQNVPQVALACRKGGMDTLNIFVIPSLGVQGAGVVLGFAYPFFLLGVNYIDGVYIHTQTLPNGGLQGYDRGLSAVHETGHWLGLIHTFQSVSPFTADPCNPTNPQDYIADTPLMFGPSFGCPVGKDSCPNSPGLDAVNNFMDYANDYDIPTGKACKTSFTPNQVTRMQDIWNYYRVQNEICATNEMQVIFELKFDNAPRDLFWNITTMDGTLVHDSTPDLFGHPYTNNFAGQTINMNFCLSRTETYIFRLFDSVGNGISPPGYYRLTVDGRLIAQGGQDFTSSKTIPFSSAAPTSSPKTNSASSASAPAPLPSAAPTPLPSAAPTLFPSAAPTPLPSAAPTLFPSAAPTPLPSDAPTPLPSESPTPLSSDAPTRSPSDAPTPLPSLAAPTLFPSAPLLSAAPTLFPSAPTPLLSAAPTPLLFPSAPTPLLSAAPTPQSVPTPLLSDTPSSFPSAEAPTTPSTTTPAPIFLAAPIPFSSAAPSSTPILLSLAPTSLAPPTPLVSDAPSSSAGPSPPPRRRAPRRRRVRKPHRIHRGGA